MVAIMLGMLMAAGVCHAVGFYFGFTGMQRKEPRRTFTALLFGGGGFLIMGFLASLCLRFLEDPDLYNKTKVSSWVLILGGAVMLWAGAMLRPARNSKPDNRR